MLETHCGKSYKYLRCKSHRVFSSGSTLKILRGKRPLGRPRHRWEDNIRMDLKEICVDVKN